MNVIFVTGDREWSDVGALREILRPHQPGAWLVHGGCRGADLTADALAQELGHHPLRMDPLWKVHGKKAGPIRNLEMLHLLLVLRKTGHPITCYACHNDLEHSKGTKHMTGLLTASDFRWTLVTSGGGPSR
jgi:hypothetical protein